MLCLNVKMRVFLRSRLLYRATILIISQILTSVEPIEFIMYYSVFILSKYTDFFFNKSVPTTMKRHIRREEENK